MPLGQRLLIAVACLVIAATAGVILWRGGTEPEVWVELRPVSLPLPPPPHTLSPGEDGRAPLLIVVENTPEARPQSGLADACLVYVMPTEARITRFLIAYCDATPPVVGPVRSARKYMLDIAADLGAVLVHAGSSAEALALIRRGGMPVINEFWTSAPFWRDGARAMPHNLYTGIDRLRAALEKQPLPVRPRGVPYAFAAAGSAAGEAMGVPATTVTLDYGPPYTVRYQYDPPRRRYAREQDGRPHLDADGRSIAPVSVLVVFVRWSEVWERSGPSSRINLTSGGRLAILTGGRLVEGTWTRPAQGPMSLQRADGGLVVLPRGPVWIELFPVDRPFTAQDEAPGPAPSLPPRPSPSGRR
jgi:hypothetical protein